MNKFLRITDTRLVWILGILFSIGVILHLFPLFRVITTAITDIFLLLVNTLVVTVMLLQNKQKTFLLYLVLASFFTYGAELAGVKTGQVFGHYHYGPTLWMQVLAVPIVIPYNWVMLVLGVTCIAGGIRIPRYTVPLLASLGLVMLDIIIEPVAMRLDFWEWDSGVVPLLNYLAWFIIALLLSSIAMLLKFDLQSRVLKAYVIIQFLFFLILNVYYRFY